MQWTQKYQGPGEQNGWSIAYSVIQSKDGGYALAGETNPYSLRSTSSYHGPFWLVKTDSTGNMQWNQMYQGPGFNNKAYSVIQASDGGFVIAGFGGSWYFTNSSGKLTQEFMGNFG